MSKKKNTPRTDRAVARIIAALGGEKKTSRQLAEELCCSVQCVNFYLRMLRAEPRRVRVCDYLHVSGRAAALYTLGTKADAKYKRTKVITTNKTEMMKKQILEELSEPLARHALMERVGLEKTRINLYLRKMREEGLIHICGWQYGRAGAFPIHKAGKQLGVPRPQRNAAKEYRKRRAAKQTAWMFGLTGAPVPGHLVNNAPSIMAD